MWSSMFGRKVDIVKRSRHVNPFIRHSILTTHRKFMFRAPHGLVVAVPDALGDLFDLL